jgi:hypothetical protein
VDAQKLCRAEPPHQFSDRLIDAMPAPVHQCVGELFVRHKMGYGIEVEKRDLKVGAFRRTERSLSAC